MAFHQLEPFGWEADLFGHAHTSAAVMNTNRPKGHKAVSPLDLMPKETEEQCPDPHSIYQTFKDIAVRIGAKKKR